MFASTFYHSNTTYKSESKILDIRKKLDSNFGFSQFVNMCLDNFRTGYFWTGQLSLVSNQDNDVLTWVCLCIVGEYSTHGSEFQIDIKAEDVKN